MKRRLQAAIVLFLAVPAMHAATCSPTTFLRARRFPTGPAPQALVSGDFNHDGHLDLAIGDASGVSVLLGDGSGGFLPPIHTELGSEPRELVAGSFDAGNNLDLAVILDYFSVGILLGNGDGTFTAGSPISITYSVANLVAADFNDDGSLDLAVTGQYGSQLDVLLGAGNGTFGQPIVTTLATGAQFIAAADFDGDDFPDVAASQSDGAVSIYRGLGNGRFNLGASLKVGGALGPIAAADLRENGTQDLVLAADLNIAIARGNGDGTFQAAIESPIGFAANAIAVADLDGDGLPDIAAMSSSGAPSAGNVAALHQELNGAFDDGGSYLVGPGSFALAAGDFDGDGLADLATSNDGAATVAVLFSLGSGSLEATNRVPLNGSVGAIAVANFLDSPRQEIAALVFDNGASVAVIARDDAGRWPTVGSTPLPGNPASMAAGRFVSGSHGDLVVSDYYNGFSVLVGRGDGTFAPPVTYAPGVPMTYITVADFNGDGISDVIAVEWQNPYPTGSIAVFLGAGDGTFTAGPTAALLYQASSLLAVDATGDGRVDVVTSNGVSSDTVSIYPGTRVDFLNPIQVSAGSQPISVAAGAFTGSNTQLIVADGGAATVALLTGAPNPTLIGVGAIPYAIVAGDFDGDGRADFATVNAGSSGVSVVLGNGDGTFRAPELYPMAPAPVVIAAGALGGALPDLVVGTSFAPSALAVLPNAAVSGTIVPPAPTLVHDAQSIGVLASGLGPLAYQWLLNGLPLADGAKYAGVTTPLLHINDVTFPDTAGVYRVAITDSCGLALVDAPPLVVEFADVPPSNIFYADVNTIATAGVTAGCGGANYCPASLVTRAQMAVFLLRSEHGGGYTPPPCAGLFADVPCPSLYADWIEQLANEGVTAGCGNGDYCPDASVTRAQMAVFLLKTKYGSSYVPPPWTPIFGDVPAGAFAADFIDDLYDQGIAGGCSASPLLYCPDNPVNRGQMAAFLVNTFF